MHTITPKKLMIKKKEVIGYIMKHVTPEARSQLTLDLFPSS